MLHMTVTVCYYICWLYRPSWPGTELMTYRDHDSTVHVTDTPALTSWPSVTSCNQNNFLLTKCGNRITKILKIKFHRFGCTDFHHE